MVTTGFALLLMVCCAMYTLRYFSLPALLLALWTLPGCDDDPPQSPDAPARNPDTRTSGEKPPDTDDTTDPAAAASPTLSSDVYRSVIDLQKLEKRGALAGLDPVEVTVTGDPAYDGETRYEGWPLGALLQRHADLPDERTGWVVQFIATDGYRATVPLDELPVDQGVVAFRDLRAPDDRRWQPFSHGDRQTTPAPYYVVWRSSGDAGDHRPWAYKLAKIAVARAEKLWGEAVPDHDSSLRPGFAVFRDHCMKCHSVNLSGGSVGPELNVPKNVTEYWKADQLTAYIRHPTSFRADAEMPSMDGNLSDEQMEDLLEYLRGMAEAKMCESAAACQAAIDRE